MVEPVFILSLPRSGSTLLQRMLAAHPKICTASEPWFLLPLVYSLREQGSYAIYDHSVARMATLDFLDACGDGSPDVWYSGVRELAVQLYQSHARKGETYFLDKTPRYVLVADELRRIFPDAKLIFLFRNPLAVLASIIETSGHTNRFRQDLYLGFDELVSAYVKARDGSHALQYEELISDPEKMLQDLCDYLELPYSKSMESNFGSVELKGRFGDKSQLKEISPAPINKWKAILSANPWRKRQARRYLKWVGPKRLTMLGYDFDSIRQDLDRTPTGWNALFQDMFSSLRGSAALLVEPAIMQSKITSIREGQRIYRHR